MSSNAEVFDAIATKELSVKDTTITDGGNIAIGTSSGTKIGTADAQKLAFHGATPIVRAVLATGSTNDQIITALQTLGLVKQS